MGFLPKSKDLKSGSLEIPTLKAGDAKMYEWCECTSMGYHDFRPLYLTHRNTEQDKAVDKQTSFIITGYNLPSMMEQTRGWCRISS